MPTPTKDSEGRAGLTPLLDPRGLADYLSVPLQTIYRWRSRPGEGPPGLKVGRHVRYRVTDVEKWLDRRSDPRSAA